MERKLKETELLARIKEAVKSEIKTSQDSSQRSIQIPESQTHSYKPWQKSCPDCLAKNPNYQGPPNLVCESCNSPLGRIDHKPNENEQYSDVPECPTCGGTRAKYVGNKSESDGDSESESDDSFWDS